MQVLEQLSGMVEHVTFHSEESGFCVLRVKVKGQRDFVTITGKAARIAPGEYVECQGNWHNDKTYGLQFRSHELKAVPPSTLQGIEKYLASGMVKGIGPHFAKKLMNAFGGAVFDIIENQPERLTELEGIGEKRRQMVVDAWAEQKVVRDIMVFLQSHDIGTSRAVRIYKTYGNNAIKQLKTNPYRLANDIRGIGFKTADNLAEKLGIAKDAMIRAQAGVRYALQTLCDHGHCAATHDELISASNQLLEIPVTIVEEAIALETEAGNLIAETIDEQSCLFPKALYQAETGSAEQLQALDQTAPPWGTIDINKVIPWVEEKTHMQLSQSQRQAIIETLRSKVSIITGGPGVGKTTLVKSLLLILRAKSLVIGLCAPTGRAAKRLTETTGLPAKTIHRLLSFEPGSYGFKHNQHNPLPIDILIVDESSMIDINLFHHLVKAIPRHAAVIFVGDIDQLPSVGPGAVLADLINSQQITTVRLTEIFRQAADSQIITNAHRINEGYMPQSSGKDSDFFAIYTDTPEQTHDLLLQLVTTRLPKHYRCNPIHEIQVLSPMNRGSVGTRSLNSSLQNQLNGLAEPKITRYGSVYSPGDKVIQLVNNYNKEIFNGDIGLIQRINTADHTLTIQFDQRIVDYDFNELDELSLAYAISIHKSQGSEFPIIVMPLVTQHYTLLARNLLYTGITRGKKLVVLIGQKKAIAMAVKNNKALKRMTKLSERLKK